MRLGLILSVQSCGQYIEAEVRPRLPRRRAKPDVWAAETLDMVILRSDGPVTHPVPWKKGQIAHSRSQQHLEHALLQLYQELGKV